jgi:hypothetical protein
MGEQVKSQEKEISESIEYYRRQGYVDDQVATLLRNQGYDDEFVDQMLSKPRNKFEGTAIKPGGRTLDLQSMLVTFLIFIICAGAILVIAGTFFGGPAFDAYMRQLAGSLGNLGIRLS